MSLDFTLNKLRELCDAICSHGYNTATVADYLGNPNLREKAVVLRHDVDRRPHRALQMAKLEHDFGIKATYYFRFNKKVFRPYLMAEVANMGHEIGYHYETLDKAKGDYVKAIQIFEHELVEFRKIVSVKTICMHGNPFTKWVNCDMWDRYDFRDFGLAGEAYLSFDDITYFSDTGRNWGGKHNVKDWLPANTSDSMGEKERDTIVISTDDIIEMVKKEKFESICLLAHPERWSSNIMDWLIDLSLDTGVNLAKWALVLRRGRLETSKELSKGPKNI